MRRCFGIAAARRKRPPRRDGYVLIMVLVLIVVAALSEAGLARKSLQRALAAQQAQAELQRRWAAASCQQTLLDDAQQRFIAWEDAEGRSPRWPAPRSAVAECIVGGYRMRVRLADEEAKLNLNALYAKQPEKFRSALLTLVSTELPLEPRPDLSRTAKLRRQTFSTWGQLFSLAAVLSQADGFDRLLAATDRITCWGDGKTNLRRCDDATLMHVVTGAVGRDAASDAIKSRRAAEEDLLLPAFLESLDLRRSEQLKLRAVLSDESTCYSLWLELADAQGRRWYHLWIAGDRQTRTPDGLISFHW
ncbi:MAG: general secretion pathway protein GspK [Planctomycetales bacterium]|nr:general secretion pathway protein GspK [Planctomycetales bacterium]